MSRKLHLVSIVVSLSLPLVPAFGNDLPPEDPSEPGGGFYSADYQPLMPAFEEAAANCDVPLELLLALGKTGSSFEDRGAEPTLEGGYGIMALRDSELSDSLKLAAKLLHTDAEALKTDAAANIRGAAAVLDRWARKAKIDRSEGLDAWLPVVIEYAGLDPESSRFFARGVYQKLQMGFAKVNAAGEFFELAPQIIGVDLQSLVPPGLVLVDPTAPVYQLMVAPTDCGNPDFPLATWNPAASCNYSTTSTNKDTIVIHIAEGSAAATISWFKNCNSGVSAQYVMDEAGGLWQMVCEKHWAYHAVCYSSRGIGIEHEGYTADTSHPEAMYQASANWARDVCNRWGIPKQKARSAPGIVAHSDVTECAQCGSHMDPGHGWNWGHYMALVNQVPDPTTFIVESRSGGKNFANYSETGTFGNSSGKSIVWDCTTGIGSRYAYMNGTNRCTYRYTPSTAGTYRVYSTWCTSANATQQLQHIVTHAGGSTSVIFDTDSDTNPCGRNVWNLLGEFYLNAGTQYTVTQTSQTYHDGMVLRADAVKWELLSAGVLPPTITRSPATLSPSCVQGNNATSQTFTVQNTGGSTLNYSITDNQSWLSVTPTSGSSTGEVDTITVNYATSGLSAGTYNATITISDANATNNPQTIAVTLTVSPAVTVFVVESRSGGQNYSSYSETGTWANSTAKSTAAGCTAGIGSRYCTISSTAKSAVFRYTPGTTGSYKVYTTNCNTTNSGNPLVHKVAHAGGTTNVNICQNSTCGTNACNKWLLLGTFTLNGGTQYTVTLDGATGAGSAPSGNAGRSDAIKWEKQ